MEAPALWPDEPPPGHPDRDITAGCAHPDCRCPVDAAPGACDLQWSVPVNAEPIALHWLPITTPPAHSREVLVLLRYRTGKQRFVVGKYHPRAQDGKQWVFRGARWQRGFVAGWAEVEMPEVSA